MLSKYSKSGGRIQITKALLGKTIILLNEDHTNQLMFLRVCVHSAVLHKLEVGERLR